MFGLTKPKLPVTEEKRLWIDRSFLRLAALVGAQRLLEATVVLPTPEHFPDRYDRSEDSLRRMFCRVGIWMQMNPTDIDLKLFVTGDGMTREFLPFFSGTTSAAGGLYHHDLTVRPQISINQDQMEDPVALVATLAHELGHVILLRPGLVDRDDPDMEQLNDLLTVFLGIGIFTANSAFRFEQHSDNTSQGWSASRLGYLSEEELGYALSRFAFERGERKPPWVSFLATNIASYMKRSADWLAHMGAPRLFNSQSKIASPD